MVSCLKYVQIIPNYSQLRSSLLPKMFCRSATDKVWVQIRKISYIFCDNYRFWKGGAVLNNVFQGAYFRHGESHKTIPSWIRILDRNRRVVSSICGQKTVSWKLMLPTASRKEPTPIFSFVVNWVEKIDIGQSKRRLQSGMVSFDLLNRKHVQTTTKSPNNSSIAKHRKYSVGLRFWRGAGY